MGDGEDGGEGGEEVMKVEVGGEGKEHYTRIVNVMNDKVVVVTSSKFTSCAIMVCLMNLWSNASKLSGFWLCY